MHFREQGKSLQLVRTTYESEKGRGVQKVVARLPRFSYTVPENVKALLTQDELVQLTDYLATLESGRKTETRNLYLRTLETAVVSATEALQAGCKPSNPAALWDAIAGLTKALKKSGHPRTLKTQPPAVQNSLLP